jgi:hypothetical protein
MMKIERKQQPVDRRGATYQVLMRAESRRKTGSLPAVVGSVPVRGTHARPRVAHLLVVDAGIVELSRQAHNLRRQPA